MLIRSPYALGSRLAISAERLFGCDPQGLPRLWVMTDPARHPDPEVLLEATPSGCGFIYRHFGAANRWDIADRLAALCRRRQITFLVSSDLALARTVGADGVHWPERMLPRAHSARARGATEIFTSAAHSHAALARAGSAGVDAAFLSPVFASRSASATRPLGPRRTALLARSVELRVHALGGVHKKTLGRLADRGLAGLALVDGIRSEPRIRT
ncbi:MAG: thiamine phosphate synthase [Pseudomonadota bacterium]|nr:thiamine phosphate synthase [Pseudomonadota bacterium]